MSYDLHPHYECNIDKVMDIELVSHRNPWRITHTVVVISLAGKKRRGEEEECMEEKCERSEERGGLLQ